MKASLATVSLTCLLLAPAATAQEGPGGAGQPAAPAGARLNPLAGQGPGAAVSLSADPKVFPATSVLPVPAAPDQLKPATVALPNEPIEPWLLTREAGPFMVVARAFQGPEAERYALALAIELRRDYGLPTYIMRMKDFAHRSVIRNVPPLAPREMKRAELTDPEKSRLSDEALVLVGNEKTLAGSEALLHKVKKIKPKSLQGMPALYTWRTALTTAYRTTNPYIPVQDLYPGRGPRDRLIAQMNSGPRSVFNCPGRYSLQVAEFSGRAKLNPGDSDPSLFDKTWLAKSPLRTAGDDAERLAEKLAKDPDIQRTGYQPYVYHDRTSSKVMIGSFTAPNDPAAGQLRNALLQLAVPLYQRKTGVMIAPAPALTDLENPDRPIKLR
jgi:hypothetical protein